MNGSQQDKRRLAALKQVFKMTIPAGREIIDGVLRKAVPQRADVQSIKDNFSRLVVDVEAEAYAEYIRAEKQAADGAFRAVLSPLLNKRASRKQCFDMLRDNFWVLDKFFLGLTNSRRPKAGAGFERILKRLFVRLNYPHDTRPVINGRPDFVLPSAAHFKRNAMDCVILTAKRTVRERWRQIVTEGARGKQFFLATLDQRITTGDLREMLRSRIYLVVPDGHKQTTESYRRAANVISFESFFKHHLDPAMQRWRDTGVL
jgi:hypothetical protein